MKSTKILYITDESMAMCEYSMLLLLCAGTFSVVKVSYVYTLILFSGGLIFMIPLLLFSSVVSTL